MRLPKYDRAPFSGIAIPPVLLAVVALTVLTQGASLGQGVVGGCRVFPPDNVWNRMIDELPADSNSAAYIASIGTESSIRVDPAIPINVVGPEVPLQALGKITYADQSDTGPVPIPGDPRLEGNGDSHMLVLQTGACRLYELYLAKKAGDTWSAGSTAYFDLNSNRLRPDGWTSTDAAGLPILPGLLRYDEVKSGQIAHALRTTVPHTQHAYLWPARHLASRSEDHSLPPMGLRLRLKRDFDISGFSPDARVVLLALKKYGAFVADNGSPLMFTATPEGWPAELIEELKRVKSDSFEAVDTSEMMLSPNSGRAGPDRSFAQMKIPYSPSITVQLDEAGLFSIVLEGDATLEPFKSAKPGRLKTFQVCQDAKGGHTLSWPTGVHGAMAVGSQAAKCSVQSFVVASDGLYATGPGLTNQ